MQQALARSISKVDGLIHTKDATYDPEDKMEVV